ncbi:Ig-like domain-containing protein [Leptospira sp. WS60.C2]
MNQLKRSLMAIVFLLSLSNCYFNPLVNSVLSPQEVEENNSLLGLLGLSGQSLLITGQIREPNGVAGVGLVLVPGKSFAPQSKSTSSGYVTDNGGRFYIPFQTGSIPFTVNKNGSYLFEFSLVVLGPQSIGFTTYGMPPGTEILGLGTVGPNEQGNFFELVQAYFINGSQLSLHQTNFGITPSTIYLEFNEPPASVETDIITWMQNYVVFTPAPIAGYTTVTVSGNQIIMSGCEQLTSNTQHTIDFTSNIKSATGKSLSPTKYSFYFSL